MKFLYPHWLWGLLILPAAYFFAVIDDRRRRAAFEKFADPRLWSTIAPELDPRAKLRKSAVTLASAAFVLIALARPQWGMHEEVAHVSGLDVMVVMDVSNSMEVEDVVPSRLKKAKHLIRTLTDRLEGDRVGLVAFAGGGMVACPLTTDLNYLMESVQIVTPKMMASQGTDIGVGLETALKSLDRGGEEGQVGDEGGPPSRAVILISDGEDHEDKGVEIAQKMKARGVKLYVIGVGTQKGGPIPIRDNTGNLVGYKKDRKGQPIVSTFRPDSLLQLAGVAGGRYWNATTGEDEVSELLGDLGALNRTELAERRYMVFEERFQYPLAVAILLFLLELSLPARKIATSGIRIAGRAAAKLFPAIFLIVILSSGGTAKASPVETYIENEKGIRAYQSGQVDEAKQSFGKAQALDPSRAELQYNQGLVQLQEGKAEEAVRSFADSAAKAMGKDPDLAARSFYNMGVAQAKKGDVKSAVKSYLAAVSQGKKLQDGAVEDAARKNLELLLKDQEKKKQQQQQQGDSQNQQNNQQQSQSQDNKSGDGKDQKNDPKDGKDQQKNGKGDRDEKDKQQPQYSQSKKQKFQSQKLSPEDADRVVSELSSREKELQQRLKAGNGKVQDNPQDW